MGNKALPRPSQTLNKAIRRPKCIIPTLEENIHNLHGMNNMTVIVVKEAFQNTPLTVKSSLMTTMFTPCSRYRWTNDNLAYPQLLRNGSAEFTWSWKICRSSVSPRSSYCGASDTEARIDHDRKLIAVLEKFDQHHVKLNVNKMRLPDHGATFMGHVITTGDRSGFGHHAHSN